jgi:hypothetical protein
MRFTVDEYAKTFKMSKEMIQNKLRTKRLNYIIEGGVTYIIVPRSSLDEEKRQELAQQSKHSASAPAPQKTTVGMIIALYQKENQQLKLKIKELETKIDRLVNDKEQMLIAERERIEEIYTAKDEQLKNLLDVINTKLLLSRDNSVQDVDITASALFPPLSPAVLSNLNGISSLSEWVQMSVKRLNAVLSLPTEAISVLSKKRENFTSTSPNTITPIFSHKG